MAYQKFLVDNVTCSRRFHITYDDEKPTIAHQEIKCPYCGIEVYSAENQPPLKLARQENLVQTAEVSDNILRECKFKDVFTEKTSHRGVSPMYTK